MTPYQSLCKQWADCQRCSLSQRRRRVVMARGQLPCAVLLVGEAPGVSEDVLDQPFVGPAGKLLDRIVRRALPPELTRCFVNLVGCIPYDEDGEKAGEPPVEAIEACAPRLQALIKLARPKLLVTVGNLSQDFLEQGYTYSIKIDRDIRQVAIQHPAAILRMNIAQQGLAAQRCVVTLATAVEDL